MYEQLYDEAVGVLFTRFYGQLIGAEIQEAGLHGIRAMNARQRQRMSVWLIDGRSVTATDQRDSDLAKASQTLKEWKRAGIEPQRVWLHYGNPHILNRVDASPSPPWRDDFTVAYSLREAMKMAGLPPDYQYPFRLGKV